MYIDDRHRAYLPFGELGKNCRSVGAGLSFPELTVLIKRARFQVAEERDQGILPTEGGAQLPGGPKTHCLPGRVWGGFQRIREFCPCQCNGDPLLLGEPGPLDNDVGNDEGMCRRVDGAQELAKSTVRILSHEPTH